MSNNESNEDEIKTREFYGKIREEDPRITYFKGNFQVSVKDHFLEKLFSGNLWFILLSSFISGCLLRFNWHFASIITFIVSLAIFKYMEKAKKEEAIEYCAKKVPLNPEKMRIFLVTINAPQNRTIYTYNDTPCEWLNDIIHKFWPYINSIVQTQIDDRGFSKEGLDVGNGHIVYLDSFTLGDKPPMITSIRVKKTGKRHDEIIMILRVVYFGNCLLLFSYKTKVFLKAKAGVKDVYFRGDAIVCFRPLIEAPPFIGGITFCLLEPPLINYDGINLANITDNKLFKNFLLSLISSYFVRPNKIYIPLLKNPHIRRELKFALPIGLCYFQIIEAENLPQMDQDKLCVFEGSSDPFCKIKVGSYQFATRVVYTNLNPYFGENFSSPVHDSDDIFKLEVFDKDEISADDFIGSIEFKLSDISDDMNYNGKDKWLPLGRSPTGAIHFRIAVFELSTNKKYAQNIMAVIEESHCKFPAALLSVYIYYVSQLSAADEEENLRPLVSLKFSNQTFQTKRSLTSNQGYYHLEDFTHFMCNDIKNDALEVTVMGENSSRYAIGENLKTFGVCLVSVNELVDSPDNMTLNQEFAIKKTIQFEKQTEDKKCGIVKMFVSLKICKHNAKVIENLKIAASVKAHIGEISANMAVAKLVKEPIHTIRNPLKTLKSIGLPFTETPAAKVAEDLVPLPATLENKCNVKARIIWPNRTTLSIEVLKVVHIPHTIIDKSYKYSINIKLSLKFDPTLKSSSTDLTKPKKLKQKDKESGIKRLEANSTKRKKLGDDVSTTIVFNDRLIYKLSPTNNIDNHLLEFRLIVHKPRKFFAIAYNSRLVATSDKISLPYVDFKGDPIEKWFELNIQEKYLPQQK